MSTTTRYIKSSAAPAPLPDADVPRAFEHGVYRLRGWRFEWTEDSGLVIAHGFDQITLTKDEVTRLLDAEPF